MDIEITAFRSWITSKEKPVPFPYRNVICPWQTRKEIHLATKFCDRLWYECDEAERNKIFRLEEERTWK
jgi:hypothetical protein